MNRRQSIQLLAGIGALSLSGNISCMATTPSILKRPIPSSGEQLPVVGLGTWQTFDVGNSDADRQPLREVLKTLVAMGGSVIDSSPMYGRSEDVVGELTTELQLKKHIFEATKVWTTGKQAGIDQMNDSMDKMNARPMDLMQVHNLVDYQTHIHTLQKWKEEGTIRYLGITHYTVSAYPDLEALIRTENLDFVQFNYNIRVREAEKSLLPLCADKGVAVLVNRPYEGGSLFRMTKGKELPGWAADFDVNSWGQFYLKYILSHPAVTCVIPGTSKPHHLKDNMQAGYGSLPDDATRKKMVEFMEKL